MPDPTNLFQNTSLVTNEFLFALKNVVRFIPNLNREFAGKFSGEMKPGESIKIRKPQTMSTRTGQTFTGQAIADDYCTMTVQDTVGVDLVLQNREQMFNLTSLREQVIEPAAATLATTVEAALLRKAVLATAQSVGVPGTTPTTLESYNDVRAIMFDSGAPEDDRNRLIISSAMGVKTNTAGLALFNPTQQIAKSFAKGYLAQFNGADVFESQVVPTLVTGAYGTSTPAAHTGTLTGASITTDGWDSNASTVKAGCVVTFANVYGVNRYTKASTGRLKQFVITADNDDTAGAMTLAISPAIVATGATQNVTAAPIDGALISIYGKAAANLGDVASKSTPTGLRFHKNAFLFASFDQPMPDGGAVGYMQRDAATGLKIRFIKSFDIDGNTQKYRFDLEHAFGVAYAELACRMQG